VGAASRLFPCRCSSHTVKGQLMRLSYSQKALVRGRLEPAFSTLLQQPRQMPSAAHVQAHGDPRQGHGCLGAQLPR